MSYDYTIKIAELQKVIKKAHKGGYSVSLTINGEYYNIKW